MKILLLINWKIRYCNNIPENLQPSDYDCPQVPFWFFRYFSNRPEVTVIDISAPTWIEKLENKIRFHIYQTIKILPRLNKFDLIIVHGSNSAMLLCALKRLLHLKTPPIIDVDISSFHQASTSGLIHRLAQFASHSFDYMIYHASSQSSYFHDQFPWLDDISEFIPLGVDSEYWNKKYVRKYSDTGNQYFISVGYRKRDWNTLIKAFNKANVQEELYLVGNPSLKVDNPKIKVLPFLSIDELMKYISYAKASIIPLDNFNYSFGQLTLLQQMAIGTPIIADDVPAIHDYISESNGVVAYEPYNCDDLANRIRFVSMLPLHDLSKLGLNNRKATEELLNEKHMARCFEKICNSFFE